MGINFEYIYFLPLGIFTILCILYCSLTRESRKIVYFPHIELFGKRRKYIYRNIPVLWILLAALLTVISLFPYREILLYPEKKVYNILLCIDVSNSMKEKSKLEIAKKILKEFILKRGKDDRIAVVVFDNEPLKITSFTSDKYFLLKIIPLIYPAMVDKGGTAMYDALIEALNLFDKNQKNKIVILLSDGGDIDSKHTIEDVILKAQKTGTKIYSIGIESGTFYRNLERISISSNGKAFFIKKDYEKALKEVFSQINKLEPVFIKKYSIKTKQPADFWVKILAFSVFCMILLKIFYRKEADV